MSKNGEYEYEDDFKGKTSAEIVVLIDNYFEDDSQLGCSAMDIVRGIYTWLLNDHIAIVRAERKQNCICDENGKCAFHEKFPNEVI